MRRPLTDQHGMPCCGQEAADAQATGNASRSDRSGAGIAQSAGAGLGRHRHAALHPLPGHDLAGHQSQPGVRAVGRDRPLAGRAGDAGLPPERRHPGRSAARRSGSGAAAAALPAAGRRDTAGNRRAGRGRGRDAAAGEVEQPRCGACAGGRDDRIGQDRPGEVVPAVAGAVQPAGRAAAGADRSERTRLRAAGRTCWGG